jgi:undecaprenyl-diphosphatase
MPPPPSTSTSAFAFARPWAATIALVLAVTLLRLTYLAFLCPYTLIEDEAHYWEWSRRLDLSYYTKGPGIAWTIAGGTSIAGDTEFGVRLASPIASAILCLAVAALARLMTSDTRSARDGRVAFFAAVALLLAPVFQTMGLMLTIDGPYAACWALAALFGWLAIHRRFRPAWIALGLAIGIGFRYKYTIRLMIPGLALFAIFSSFARPQPAADLEADAAPRRDAFPSLIQSLTRSTWPWVVAGVIALLIAIAPVLLWNAREGWPTIRHLLGHLGLAGGDMPIHSGTATDPTPPQAAPVAPYFILLVHRLVLLV